MAALPNSWLKSLLLIEFVFLFVALPCLFYGLRYQVAPYLMFILITLFVWCLLLLLADSRFKRFRLWNLQQFRPFLPKVLKHFLAAAVSINLATWYLAPDWLFALPLEQTIMWLGLLLLYPVLSAWPQEVIFRTYLFHRYKRLFKSKQLRAWLSAGCFALAHLMFANWIAVVGAFIAGLVFAFTYMHSRSTVLVAVEHSLWGCWLFTAGLGVHFDSTRLV